MSVPAARSNPTLREVSNINLDLKDRIAAARQVIVGEPRLSGSLSGRIPSTRYTGGRTSSSGPPSPQFDRRNRENPIHCTEFASEIVDMFLTRERAMLRDANYMAAQTEVTEKMRTILVDWLVDVHLKFKLHEETYFLAVDIVDRYLMSARVSRSQLQLVGVTAMLLAAKYEEIWAPEVKDCIHISANTYTRDELLRMERAICAALQFKLTVPTAFPFLARLLETTEADATTKNTAFYILEQAMLDYKHLQFLPSQLANASMYIANIMLHKADPWNYTLQYYSKAKVETFHQCAKHLLEFCSAISSSKYQAARRKYSSAKYSEVALVGFPAELPMEL